MQKPRIEEYYQYSNEKKVLTYLLKEKLRPHYKSALDVGAGSGIISEVLYQRCENLTVCEPNNFYHETLKNRFPKADLIPVPVQYADLKSYDCILISQGLYYHMPEYWIHYVEKMKMHLKTRGDLHIVVNSDQGDWWNAIERIWQRHPSALGFHYKRSSEFIAQLQSKYSIKTMRFDYEMNFPERSSIESYIKNSCTPLKFSTPELEKLRDDYLDTIPKEKLKLNYTADLITLSIN